MVMFLWFEQILKQGAFYINLLKSVFCKPVLETGVKKPVLVLKLVKDQHFCLEKLILIL
jgi:hypothetical protein